MEIKETRKQKKKKQSIEMYEINKKLNKHQIEIT